MYQYPSIDDKKFGAKLLAKKEYQDVRFKGDADRKIDDLCDNNFFELRPYQAFARNYISMTTPYSDILLFHSTGTGKTCTSITIAENHRNYLYNMNKRIIVVLSSSLVNNFKSGIHALPIEYIDPETKMAHEVRNPIQCTGANAIYGRYDINDTAKKRKRDAIIKEFYDIMTYRTLLKHYAKGEEHMRRIFDNTVIIVDEAHNLREDVGAADENKEQMSSSSRSRSSSSSVSIASKKHNGKHQKMKPYDALLEILKLTPNSKLVLMTATPIYDSPEEIISIANLYNAHKGKPMMVRKDLFKTNGTTLVKGAKKIIKRAFKGIISFIDNSNFKTFSDKTPYDERYSLVPMEPSHEEWYRTNIINGNNVVVDGFTGCNLNNPKRKPLQSLFREFGQKKKQKKFAKVSTKYQRLINNIKNGRGNGNLIFIYCSYISTIVEIKALLDSVGYKGKYIALDGRMNKETVRKALARFNSPDNVSGKNVKILIGSPIFKEGISLQNVTQIHIMNPWFNQSRLDQIIGRGLRHCSHRMIKNPFVSIFVYVATYQKSSLSISSSSGTSSKSISSDTNNIKVTMDTVYKDVKNQMTYDEYAMHRCNAKKRITDEVLGIMRSIAVDCSLYKEYHKSIYPTLKCAIKPKKGTLTDVSTYSNFHKAPFIEKIVQIILWMFRRDGARAGYSIDDVRTEYRKRYNEAIKEEYLQHALYKLVPVSKSDYINGYIVIHKGIEGYCIRRKSHIFFQPFDSSSRKARSLNEKMFYEERTFGDIYVKNKSYNSTLKVKQKAATRLRASKAQMSLNQDEEKRKSAVGVRDKSLSQTEKKSWGRRSVPVKLGKHDNKDVLLAVREGINQANGVLIIYAIPDEPASSRSKRKGKQCSSYKTQELATIAKQFGLKPSEKRKSDYCSALFATYMKKTGGKMKWQT